MSEELRKHVAATSYGRLLWNLANSIYKQTLYEISSSRGHNYCKGDFNYNFNKKYETWLSVPAPAEKMHFLLTLIVLVISYSDALNSSKQVVHTF